jgi:hypothetical protein
MINSKFAAWMITLRATSGRVERTSNRRNVRDPPCFLVADTECAIVSRMVAIHPSAAMMGEHPVGSPLARSLVGIVIVRADQPALSAQAFQKVGAVRSHTAYSSCERYVDAPKSGSIVARQRRSDQAVPTLSGHNCKIAPVSDGARGRPPLQCRTADPMRPRRALTTMRRPSPRCSNWRVQRRPGSHSEPCVLSPSLGQVALRNVERWALASAASFTIIDIGCGGRARGLHVTRLPSGISFGLPSGRPMSLHFVLTLL